MKWNWAGATFCSWAGARPKRHYRPIEVQRRDMSVEGMQPLRVPSGLPYISLHADRNRNHQPRAWRHMVNLQSPERYLRRRQKMTRERIYSSPPPPLSYCYAVLLCFASPSTSPTPHNPIPAPAVVPLAPPSP